ncbi:transcriptional regulator [Curtobacterium sp. BH-2-1-1]|uniref:helix-turn-helix transcriptional regulator n=1 Tax=Curtobacterium sp. BH-2-1-1 TaxID=1905847 RepID=UPI00089DF6D1|nr:helix-turn-helix transcriptional regulator [Curtobacterium sp. BH-2-1-1]AOX66238.1 transcriptional regulator [Curtobacterium sp. BH-2-1-1]
MDSKQEASEFLSSRRAKVTPELVGLPAGSNRRVPGLKRAEVAFLADMSSEYYARIERGNLVGVSEPVLAGIARALLLDDAEREHLFNLARAAGASPVRAARSKRPDTQPRVGLQRTLDAIERAPAIVRNGRMDLVAANAMGWALYSEVEPVDGRHPNFARFTFLEQDRAERFYPDWEGAADIAVAILRIEAGRDPHDRELQDLVGELSTRSVAFRTRWGRHDVRNHSEGVKRFRHPVVGELSLTYETADLSIDRRLNLCIYTAEPGSDTAQSLGLLGSWWATQRQATGVDIGGAQA